MTADGRPPTARRARFIFIVWLLGILFPLAWLGRFSPAYRCAFEAVFAPLWMHVLMHALLFAGLAILLVVAFKPFQSVKMVLAVAAVILAIGGLQEGFQWLSRGHFAVAAAAFDLGVDLAGGMVGFKIGYLVRRDAGGKFL
jgi:hypothetical protein